MRTKVCEPADHFCGNSPTVGRIAALASKHNGRIAVKFGTYWSRLNFMVRKHAFIKLAKYQCHWYVGGGVWEQIMGLIGLDMQAGTGGQLYPGASTYLQCWFWLVFVATIEASNERALSGRRRPKCGFSCILEMLMAIPVVGIWFGNLHNW